jgi:hypothetical protein
MHSKRVAVAEVNAGVAPAKEPAPLRWWQWLLMYPTLALAIVGAVPQYLQWLSAISIGVPLSSNVSSLKEQNEAWSRNANCLSTIDHVKPATETTYAIDILACPSGDILVTLTPVQNPNAQQLKWIVTKDIVQHEAHWHLLSSAFAQEPAATRPTPHATRVVGVKSDGDLIIRRVQLSDGTCEDQTINSYTGRLLSRRQAPCDRFDSR